MITPGTDMILAELYRAMMNDSPQSSDDLRKLIAPIKKAVKENPEGTIHLKICPEKGCPSGGRVFEIVQVETKGRKPKKRERRSPRRR